MHFWMWVRDQQRRLQHKYPNYLNGANQSSYVYHSGENAQVWVTPIITLVCLKEEKVLTALSPEMVFMMSDTAESRQSLYHYMEISRGNSVNRGRTQHVVHLIDSLFTHLSEGTYEVIACLESLTQSAIVLREQDNPGRTMLFDTTVRTLMSVSDAPEVLTIIVELINTYTNASKNDTVRMIGEMMCCYRLWGHPPLDAAGAADKVRGYMESEFIVDPEVNREIYAMWFLLVVNGYSKKNGGTWPPMVFPEHQIRT